MKISKPFRKRIYALILLQASSLLLAIVLLQRMGPTLQHVKTRDLHSIEMSEKLLVLLSWAEDRDVLGEMRELIDEEQKKTQTAVQSALLVELQKQLEPALEKGVLEKRNFISTLLELTKLHHDAIGMADEKMQRLALGGSWALILLGMVGMIFGLYVLRDVLDRVLNPLWEICDVMRSWRKGDYRRRCGSRQATGDLSRAMETINHLLDKKQSPHA